MSETVIHSDTSHAPLHPRPQFTRANWIDLCGEWQFAYDDADEGLLQRWFKQPSKFDRTILVPFPPESNASGIGDKGFHPYVWYRRTFKLDPAHQGRLLLHFGAVDYIAQVWVNGQMVAQHMGGNASFSADITTALDPDAAEQEIVVRAEDDPHDLLQPRGKQYWELKLRTIWYHRTTGIWQPVWLEAVPVRYLDDLRWTPHVDQSAVEMQINVQHLGKQANLRLRVQITFDGKMLADDYYTVSTLQIKRTITLKLQGLAQERHLMLWSPEHPTLIDATVTLYDGDSVVDQAASYFGLRKVGTERGRFTLNGYNYYLRMVLEQGYYPESHLAAPSEQAIHDEVEWIKKLGFNAVRIHQKVEDPRFLYWCDKLGVIVWGEMANAYEFSPQAAERFTREWLEVIHRDYNHPCIVAWTPINESWGTPNLTSDPMQRDYIRALYHLTHTMDSTRLVLGNEGWEQPISDIIGIHDYNLNGSVLVERYKTTEDVEQTLEERRPGNRLLLLDGFPRNEQPVMITEFGGMSFEPKPGETWYAYGTVKTSEEYIAKYAEIVNALYESNVVCGFCFTQLTDTEQEINGMLDAQRQPKADPEALAAINLSKAKR